MVPGAHCVHVVEEGFAPRRPNAGTARGEDRGACVISSFHDVVVNPV